MLPPSVLFLDRRVYLSAVVVLASAFLVGATAARRRRLQDWFGVDRRTLARWQTWWQETFPQSERWARIRGLLVEVATRTLPRSLLRAFRIRGAERLARLLRCLAVSGLDHGWRGEVAFTQRMLVGSARALP